MKIVVKQNRENYYKSRVRMLIYLMKKDKAFIWYIFFYVIIFICWVLNSLEVIKFFPTIIDMLVFVLGMGIFAMIIYMIFDFIFKLRMIQKDSRKIRKIEIEFDFMDSGIKMRYNDVYNNSYYWKSFKGFLLLKKTMYIIPISKNDPLIVINQEDIVEGSLNSILNFLELKLNIID